ncbi:MAG: 50S ribosomal protein L4 [Candidatus Micrarchaeota archaeon]|nr:50S ribosomal protein L4 [Candidatus Micrarchaeota archaeon]
MEASVNSLDGNKARSIQLPHAFSEQVRPDLINRAVNAENSARLQPQGHFALAGMQTTARYYGAMSSYRTGRHMGRAIRPREKLGGGAQGRVRRIPSSVKGKRAHPHVIEKILIENINAKEYQKAMASSVAATASKEYARHQHPSLPLVMSNDIESIKRTKEVVALLERLKLDALLEKGAEARARKGVRRSARQTIRPRTLLIVVGEDKGIIKSARNIPGVDVCKVEDLKVGLLAPGGMPGRMTVWSESAIASLEEKIKKMKLM